MRLKGELGLRLKGGFGFRGSFKLSLKGSCFRGGSGFEA